MAQSLTLVCTTQGPTWKWSLRALLQSKSQPRVTLCSSRDGKIQLTNQLSRSLGVSLEDLSASLTNNLTLLVIIIIYIYSCMNLDSVCLKQGHHSMGRTNVLWQGTG